MNYLSHLVVSPGTPLFLAGALAGDFVHGRLSEMKLPEELRRGIELHRAVDAFADSHPAVAESRRRLAEYRHHARIIVDVFYDFLLARRFEAATGEGLAAFIWRTYAQLEEARSTGALPSAVAGVIANLVRYDSLSSYGELESVRRALTFLSSRLRRPVDMAAAVRYLEADAAGFAHDFERFWPELKTFAEARRARS